MYDKLLIKNTEKYSGNKLGPSAKDKLIDRELDYNKWRKWGVPSSNRDLRFLKKHKKKI